METPSTAFPPPLPPSPGQNPEDGRSRPSTPNAPSPAPASSAPPPKPAPPPRRPRRPFRTLTVVLLVLLVLLVVAELLTVRFFPGYSSHYLVASTATDGTPVWIDNAFFPLRFGPRRSARPPLPVVAAQNRPADRLRVVLLGDSALMGEPDPSFSPGRILEALLNARLAPSSRTAEVFTLGIPNANSHVLREIARDLPRLRPDAVVVMVGDNEFAGPGGPASPAGRFHNSSRIAHALIVASRTRLAQLWAATNAKLFPVHADTVAWRDQEPLPLRDRLALDDPRRSAAARSYRRNLKAVLSLARDSSPLVVPCTLPVNLRDCAPFATSYLPSEADAQRVRELLRAATADERNDRLESAFHRYSDLFALNPRHAEALFRAATIALRLDRPNDARELFRRAADADALPLRATSSCNETLLDLASRYRLEPLDADALFASLAADGIPGNDLFLDHVHFTFEASHALASAILARLEASPDFPLDPPPAGAPALPTPAELAGRFLYSPWGQLAQLESLRESQLVQPFLRQLTHSNTVARLTEAAAHAKRLADAVPADRTHAIFARRLAAHPDDVFLAARAARYLLAAGDPSRAEAAARSALAAWPHRFDLRSLLAYILSSQGQPMQRGLQIIRRPDEFYGYYDVNCAVDVASALAAAGQPDLALPWLDYALSRDPFNSQAAVLSAQSLYRADRPDDAIALLQKQLELTPDNPLLWDELSVLWCLTGEWSLSDEALHRSEAIAPYRYDRLYKRAEALVRIHQYRRALNPIERYLAANPDDPSALALHDLIRSRLPAQPAPEPAPQPAKKFIWE